MIGRSVGNYQVVSLIGDGGMGLVYMAQHPQIDRKVAIKVLRDNLSRDADIVTRFLNEARAASGIRHKNIIEILDTGSLQPEGTPYIVMEFLEGESLAERIKRLGRMAIADAIEIAGQTAAALTAAHAKGIVHRDLKPANLYLVPDEGSPNDQRVKVLDFGIAKVLGAFAGQGLRTQTGSILGTPVYMSPEQCRGSKQIDHRSDIYSLGVILYELICGAPPFVAEGFGEIIAMQLTAAPAPPSVHNEEIPEALEQVVLRMLAKNPDDRYGSCEELRGALGLPGGRPRQAPAVLVAAVSTNPSSLASRARAATIEPIAADGPRSAPGSPPWVTRVASPSIVAVPPGGKPTPAHGEPARAAPLAAQPPNEADPATARQERLAAAATRIAGANLALEVGPLAMWTRFALHYGNPRPWDMLLVLLGLVDCLLAVPLLRGSRRFRTATLWSVSLSVTFQVGQGLWLMIKSHGFAASPLLFAFATQSLPLLVVLLLLARRPSRAGLGLGFGAILLRTARLVMGIAMLLR